MNAYHVFIAAEVVESLRCCSKRDQQALTRWIEELGRNPFKFGDYVEHDAVGRPIQASVVGRYAILFWADHAVREIKIVDFRSAGS